MNIYSLTPSAAADYLVNNGLRASQTDNIFDDIYRCGADCFDDMTLTSKDVRTALMKSYEFSELEVLDISDSADTAKYLFGLADGNTVETVLMRQKYGSSVCISTQSGCNMGCKFCASGKLKKIRNLTAGEMISQILHIQRSLNVTVSNITVMGIGEPFDNYDNLCDFLELASCSKGLAIGEKHITVSTCGIVPRIYDFASRKNPCNLAISLHAPNDELRNELMPVNKAYPLTELIKAAAHYSEVCNKKVLMEYVMLDGINDSREHASQLARLLKGTRLFVNIIPYNPSDGSGFSRSSRERIMEFYDELKKHGTGVTMRREFGTGMNAACGQLRSDRMKEKEV